MDRFTGRAGSVKPKKIDKLAPAKWQWSDNALRALGLTSKSAEARLMAGAVASVATIERECAKSVIWLAYLAPRKRTCSPAGWPAEMSGLLTVGLRVAASEQQTYAVWPGLAEERTRCLRADDAAKQMLAATGDSAAADLERLKFLIRLDFDGVYLA